MKTATSRKIKKLKSLELKINQISKFLTSIKRITLNPRGLF